MAAHGEISNLVAADAYIHPVIRIVILPAYFSTHSGIEKETNSLLFG